MFVSEILNNFFLCENFSGSGHFETFSNHLFNFFQSESAKSGKINSFKVHRVFNLLISLTTLILPTVLSFSRCYKLLGAQFFTELILKKYIMTILQMAIFRFQFVTGPYVTSWARSTQHKSPTCQVSWPQVFPKRICYAFSLSRDHTSPHCQRIM